MSGSSFSSKALSWPCEPRGLYFLPLDTALRYRILAYDNRNAILNIIRHRRRVGMSRHAPYPR